ncbi:MAG: DUF2971 domain-containing protein [Nibricoccus sp.]
MPSPSSDPVGRDTIRLFRYFNSHAYESLNAGELLVSPVSNFNDPFEFRYQISGDLTQAKAQRHVKRAFRSSEALQALRKKFPQAKRDELRRMLRDPIKIQQAAKDFISSNKARSAYDEESALARMDIDGRMCCFSSTEVTPFEEILLWSHYSAKHTGVRIGFELLLDGSDSHYNLRPVRYAKERVRMDIAADPRGVIIKDSLREAMYTKALGWEYEREHRLFTLRKYCRERTTSARLSRTFLPFHPDVVWTVDFGIRCPAEEQVKISSLVRRKYPNALLRKGSIHPTNLAIIYTPIPP